MVTVTPRYSSLTLESEYGTSKVHERRPVDDLLSIGTDSGRDLGVFFDYRRPFGLDRYVGEPPPDFPEGAETIAGFLMGIRHFLARDDLKAYRVDLIMAAAQGASGYLLPAMGDWLKEVRFVGGGAVEVPTLEALAAWSLLRAIEGGGYELRKCDLCGDLFLSSGKSNYCRRYAIGSPADNENPQKPRQTCLEVAKVRDYRKSKKEGATRGHDR